MVKFDNIVLHLVSTKVQLADIFTKAIVQSQSWQQLCDLTQLRKIGQSKPPPIDFRSNKQKSEGVEPIHREPSREPSPKKKKGKAKAKAKIKAGAEAAPKPKANGNLGKLAVGAFTIASTISGCVHEFFSFSSDGGYIRLLIAGSSSQTRQRQSYSTPLTPRYPAFNGATATCTVPR